MRVIVAHPNAQHSHRLALAVQKAGWLQAYVTQFYYDPTKLPYSLVKLFPNSLQIKISDKLSRRNLEGLDHRFVKTYYTWAEIVFILLNRAHIARRFRERWLLNRAEVFSKRVGKLAAECADMVIGTDTASYHTFRIARSAGVVCVLDLSSVHIKTRLRFEMEERIYAPIFSRTLDTYAQNLQDQQNAVEEIELADAVIVASTFAKESLIENGVDEKRIHVVPYGVDVRHFRAGQHLGEIYSPRLNILFVGGIGQLKGIGYLLKAVHDLNESLDITTTLVGHKSRLLFNLPMFLSSPP
jgi:glycosyltransferase involved in cell wall biosynthesis